MTIHQITYRSWRGPIPDAKSYPLPFEIVAAFGPEEVFGPAKPTPTTNNFDSGEIKATWDCEEGRWHVTGKQREPVDMQFRYRFASVRQRGSTLTLEANAQDENQLQLMVFGFVEVMPAIMSFVLREFVWFKKVQIRWASSVADMLVPLSGGDTFDAKTWDKATNEGHITRGIQAWTVFDANADRLISAMYYLRQAASLRGRAIDSQGVLPEMVMNLVKAIQMVFGESREAVRDTARSIGITDKVIETRIIPLMLIRNELDTGHASSPLLPQDRDIVRQFIGVAYQEIYDVFEEAVQAYLEGRLLLSRWTQPDTKLVQALRSYVATNA